MTIPRFEPSGRPRLVATVLLFCTCLAATATEPTAPQPAKQLGGWRPKQQPVIQAAATAALPPEPQDAAAPAPETSEPPAAAATPAPTPPVAPAAEPIAAPPAVPIDGPAPTQQVADQNAQAVPACSQCGATCNLVPVCRCEPATRKKPRTIYESKCELVCEPGIGLVGHHHPKQQDGCTACEPACGPSRICTKKTLIKTVKEDEVCHVKREVGYLCRCCAGECRGCDAAGCAAKPKRRRPPLFDWKPFGWLETFWK